jgi:AMMECR1 domain-containing protein
MPNSLRSLQGSNKTLVTWARRQVRKDLKKAGLDNASECNGTERMYQEKTETFCPGDVPQGWLDGDGAFFRF